MYIIFLFIDHDRTPNCSTVLHPYYKLDYVIHNWGGEEEQRKEIEAGNPNAKNWQHEAMKVIEGLVRVPFFFFVINDP